MFYLQQIKSARSYLIRLELWILFKLVFKSFNLNNDNRHRDLSCYLHLSSWTDHHSDRGCVHHEDRAKEKSRFSDLIFFFEDLFKFFDDLNFRKEKNWRKNEERKRRSRKGRRWWDQFCDLKNLLKIFHVFRSWSKSRDCCCRRWNWSKFILFIYNKCERGCLKRASLTNTHSHK